MELPLLVKEQGAQEVGRNVREALWAMGDNSGHIRIGMPVCDR